MTDPGTARVTVEQVGSHLRLTDLRSSRFLSPRPLLVEGSRARIALVGLCATLLAGDDLRLEIEVGAGVHLELVEPTGTVAYNAKGGNASWSAAITVAEEATLTWAAAPFVVAGGADVRRHTKITLAHTARALFQETLILGRSGECGGRLRACLNVTQAERPLLMEDLDLRDAGIAGLPGILGTNRVLSTIALLGLRPEPSDDQRETSLAGPGALARALAVDAHRAQATLAETWRRWHAMIRLPSQGEDAPGP